MLDVRERIVSGRITEATEVLNDRLPVLLSKSPSETAAVPVIPSLSSSLTSKQYSPSASVEPIHLSLNLRIMAFIELCRTVRLDYPPPSTPSNEPPPYAHDPELKERQLALVRKLWADVQLLEKASDREAYLEEVKNVMFILAFDAPEKKTPAKYLSQARREAVADQIDCAILCKIPVFVEPGYCGTRLISLCSYVLRSVRTTSDIQLGALHPIYLNLVENADCSRFGSTTTNNLAIWYPSTCFGRPSVVAQQRHFIIRGTTLSCLRTKL